jgi:hypothetical protein
MHLQGRGFQLSRDQGSPKLAMSNASSDTVDMQTMNSFAHTPNMQYKLFSDIK